MQSLGQEATGVIDGRPAILGRAGNWAGERIAAASRGLAITALTPTGAAVLLALARALAFGRPGHGSSAPGTFLLQSVLLLALAICLVLLVIMLVPGVPAALRRLANLNRRLAEQWCRVPIAVPYLPHSGGAQNRKPGYTDRLRWLLSDPATWRDLLWLGAVSAAGLVLAALPAELVLYGSIGFLDHLNGPQGPWLWLPLQAAAVAAGLWAAPWLLHTHGMLARTLLAPSGRARIQQRLRHLAQTRTETIDSGAAELRRIERDLHDGAQARLVAIGMTLDAASRVVNDNPAAQALLARARESSAKALAELRDLVRGIHPPVLADRGLAEAIRALALDLPLPVHFASELEGRLPAPVESAAYFAVSELLANVPKHACARQAWIDIGHERGILRIAVTDDGIGGADPSQGSGLAGIERRLAAFDGVLALSSPPGGPTVVNLEIPCALSSPRTFSS